MIGELLIGWYQFTILLILKDIIVNDHFGSRLAMKIYIIIYFTMFIVQAFHYAY